QQVIGERVTRKLTREVEGAWHGVVDRIGYLHPVELRADIHRMPAFEPGYIIRIAVIITDRNYAVLGCETRKEKIDPRRLLARRILIDIDKTQLRIIALAHSRAYRLSWPVVHPIISEMEFI